MTDATLGIGSKAAYETTLGASPLAFTDVPECLDIPDLTQAREFLDATNQDSGDTKEYIAGLNDVQEFELSANYLPQDSAQKRILDFYNDRQARYWEVRETTTSPVVTWRGLAVVSSFAPSMPVQGKKVLKFKLRWTGPLTRI